MLFMYILFVYMFCNVVLYCIIYKGFICTVLSTRVLFAIKNILKSHLFFTDMLQRWRSEETLYGSLACHPTFVNYEYLMIRVYVVYTYTINTGFGCFFSAKLNSL